MLCYFLPPSINNAKLPARSLPFLLATLAFSPRDSADQFVGLRLIDWQEASFPEHSAKYNVLPPSKDLDSSTYI